MSKQVDYRAVAQHTGDCEHHASTRALLLVWSRVLGRLTPSYNTLYTMIKETCRNDHGPFNIDGVLRYIGDPGEREQDESFRDALRAAKIRSEDLHDYFRLPHVDCDVGAALDGEHVFITSFFLSEGQWGNFKTFYDNYPHGMLTQAALNSNLPLEDEFKDVDCGHACVVDNFGPRWLARGTVLINSWGTTFARQGRFAVDDLNTLQPRLSFLNRPPKLYRLFPRGTAVVDPTQRLGETTAAVLTSGRQIGADELGEETSPEEGERHGRRFRTCHWGGVHKTSRRVLIMEMEQTQREVPFFHAHQNILHVHGHCEVFGPRDPHMPTGAGLPSGFVVVMELGDALDNINMPLRELSLNDRLMLLGQIASAVAFLAGCGVNHGYISSSSIFRCDGVWKLVDFGTPNAAAHSPEHPRLDDRWRLGELIRYLELGPRMMPGLAAIAQQQRCSVRDIQRHVQLAWLVGGDVLADWHGRNLDLLGVINDAIRRSLHDVLACLYEMDMCAYYRDQALLIAAADGSDVTLLLAAHASRSAVDQQGRTPLHLAAQYGNLRTLARLSTHATVNHHALNGETPIDVAARYGHADAVACLQRYERHVFPFSPICYAVFRDDRERIRDLQYAGASVDTPFDVVNHVTPLMHAARHGQEYEVAKLLEYGARVDVRDAFGRSAAFHAAEAGQCVCLRRLVDQRAELGIDDGQWGFLIDRARQRGCSTCHQILEEGRRRRRVVALCRCLVA